MMYFVEYRIKNAKVFWKQWEKAQGHLPANCHFIQGFSSKDGELAIAVWNVDTLPVLETFIREYFTECSQWKCHELDRYHVEGNPIKKRHIA